MTVKSIKFTLLPITQIKKNELQIIADNFKLLYNTVACRLSGLTNVKQSKLRSLLNKWRKDLQPITVCHSKIAEESMEFARANYQTIQTIGETTNPILKENIIRFHNQIFEFKNFNDRWYIEIPTIKIGARYKKILLPIKNNEYYNDIIKNNTKFGAGQLNIDKNIFITSITVEDIKIKYKPETFIGIDLGKNNLAIRITLTNDYKFKGTHFWNGKENRHLRKMFDNYHQAVQKIHREDLTEDSDHHEHNWMKNVNHNISREIVEYAKKYNNPIIILEDLHRFAKFKWNFYQLRQMIEYKAKEMGILTDIIPPAHTSQKCPKCGNINKLNREGINFKCLKCGSKYNADFVGAYNIASKGIEKYK